MKPRVTIIAALPRELQALVQGWRRSRDAANACDVFEQDHAVAVCAGMGASRARYAAQRAAATGPLAGIISAGYAGALRNSIARETVHWAACVVDGATGEQFPTEDSGPGLLTVDHVLSVPEKAAAGQRYDAGLVDMEAAAVASVAQSLGVPFRAVKAVTDCVDDALPDVSAFVGRQGEFLEHRYVRHLLLHPWLMPQAMQMGRRSAVCSRLLAQELERAIARSRE